MCEKSISISKFYPSGGFIAGPGQAGWWASNPYLSDNLNKFYDEHMHNKDASSFGGYQYSLEYEVPDE